MATVHKVTVSLPDQLLGQIEKLRQRTGGTRSGIITDLLWRGWHDVEQEEREARYRAVYATVPGDTEGTAFIDAASADFFVDADTWPGPETDPPRKPHEER